MVAHAFHRKRRAKTRPPPFFVVVAVVAVSDREEASHRETHSFSLIIAVSDWEGIVDHGNCSVSSLVFRSCYW